MEHAEASVDTKIHHPSVSMNASLTSSVAEDELVKFVLGESVFDFDGDIDMEHAEAPVDTKTNNIESIRQNFVAFASAFSSKEDGSRPNFDEEIDSLFESTFHEMFVYDTPSQRFERAHVKEMYRAHVEVMGTRMSVIECHVDQEGRFEASLQIQNPCINATCKYIGTTRDGKLLSLYDARHEMRDVFSLAVLRMNLGIYVNVQNNAERNLGDLHAIVERLFDNNSSATSLSHAHARQSVHEMKCRLFDDFVQSARVALGGFEVMKCVECQRRGIHCYHVKVTLHKETSWAVRRSTAYQHILAGQNHPLH